MSTCTVCTDTTILIIALSILIYSETNEIVQHQVKEGHWTTVHTVRFREVKSLLITHIIMSCSSFLLLKGKNNTGVYGGMQTFALGYPKLCN